MATAKESQKCQQFTARNSSYLDQMAFPNLEQNLNLPYYNPYKCTANAALPGQYASELPSLNICQQGAVGGPRKPLLLPDCNILYPTEDPCLKDSQCGLPSGVRVVDKPVVAFAPQRRFLIFDQSENQTRLFLGPSFSPLDQIFASKAPASANGSCEKVAAQVDQRFLKEPLIEEKWDENHLSDREGEMLEDSEEIDALLYSDSNGDDDDDGDNDEVTSTGQSPLLSLEEGHDRYKLLNELMEEEVASSDELPKRQRLFDGKYKKSSFESGESPKRHGSCSYEDDVEESSCAGERNLHDDDGIDSSKREMKVKIREALRMLESIIPGLDETDPYSIIDGAVAYLKAMRSEAELLGLSHHQKGSSSTTSS